MADVIVSAVAERLIALLGEHIGNEVKLVIEAENDLRDLSAKLKSVRGVLNDAESKRFKDNNVNNWLSRLEHTAYKMEDVLDEWSHYILKLKMEHDQSNSAVAGPPKKKVRLLFPYVRSSFQKVGLRRDIAKKIENVKAQLDRILAEKDQYNFVISQPTFASPESWRVQSSSFIDIEEIHGRDIDRDNLVRKLMANAGQPGFQILSIVGVGGLGKTTLAQIVNAHSEVEKYFQLRIWICVSDPFNVAGIAKGILERVKGSSPDTNQLDVLLHHLKDSISGKKFLLILDDVWSEDDCKWKPLRKSLEDGGAGSTILVTTRNEGVAKMMGTKKDDIYKLAHLSDDDCWILLRSIAFSERTQKDCELLEEIGKNIAKKCSGSPLAAKTLGGLLRDRSSLDEWKNILNSEIWKLEEVEEKLFPYLLLSYNELSPAIKRCFSYCAVFSKDFKIDVERLISFWIAQGYLDSNIRSVDELEFRGRRFFNTLAMRSLFQDFEKSETDGLIKNCKMHDVVHDFAQFVRKNGKEEVTGEEKTACQVCKHLLVSSVEFYRSLFLNGSDEVPSKICDCLTSLKVLGMAWYGLRNVPQGMEKLIHLRWLDLSHNDLSMEDIKTICMLYHLQTLLLRNCEQTDVPWEIGNLIHLRHLDLSANDMQELPESICGLCELQTLNVNHCTALCGLPQGINKLVKLKRLHNELTESLKQFPEGLGQLTGLTELTQFGGGSGCSKLGLLKNLNGLCGFLELSVYLAGDLEEVVADAREAELNQKKHIQELKILFYEESLVEAGEKRDELIDALEPHRNLEVLEIYYYKDSKPPRWISSPVNQLKVIALYHFQHMSSLPALGELPCLEEISILKMDKLESVGRELLGITATIGGGDIMDAASSSKAPATAAANTIAFPKLRTLRILGCPKWKIWEDISEEEEESAAMSFMPRLTKLCVQCHEELTELPHRLLRKASSLEKVDIRGSTKLIQRYGDDNGLAWRSLSQNNPGLKLEM